MTSQASAGWMQAPPDDRKKTVLFFRRVVRLTGGHLKVWDYFRHTLASGDHAARIVFSPDTVWTDANPWRDSRQYVVPPGVRVQPDVYFLDGGDWANLPPAERASSPIPVINVIGGVHHGDPKSPGFALLRCRAIRICVSQEVANAIRAHGEPNGPVFVIPDAVDVSAAPAIEGAGRDVDIVVVAVKQPELGARLAARLARPGRRVELLKQMLPRNEFLRWLARSTTALFLPSPTEGFYLPAIEAMALGTLVVCPDAIGNRDYCRDGVNCFFPPFHEDAILDAAERALGMTPDAREAMVREGLATAAGHGLDQERKAYLAVLRDAPALWRG